MKKPLKKVARKRVAVKKVSPNRELAGEAKSFRETLKNKSKAELTDMLVKQFVAHDSVRKEYEKKEEVREAQKPESPEKLLEKAMKLIGKGTIVDRHDSYFIDHYGVGEPNINLKPVREIIKQLATEADPFPWMEKIADRLLKKSNDFFNQTGAETGYEFEITFEEMAVSLLKNKADAVRLVQWALDVDDRDEYCISNSFCDRIVHYRWTKAVYAKLIDKLTESAYSLKNPYGGRQHMKALLLFLTECGRKKEWSKILEDLANRAKTKNPKMADYFSDMKNLKVVREKFK